MKRLSAPSSPISEHVLEQIAADTGTPVEAHFVPVSALKGDNVVHSTGAMPWYAGPSLLELLEALPSRAKRAASRSVFPCSACCGPITLSADLRDRLRRARCAAATRLRFSRRGASAKIERIVTFDGDLDEAIAPLSVTLVLDREVDISRGDLIAGCQMRRPWWRAA